jgi:hypothetical protein
MAETLQDLYGKLEKANIKLPDYNTFEKKYNTEGGADILYEKLNSANVKLPDVNTFKTKYFSNSSTQEVIVPTGKTVDGIPTVTLENKTIVEQPKQEVTKPKDPYNNYFKQKFKEFGGNDVNDFENPVNIISRQKAWDATKNFKSKMQYATPEDIQIDAVKNIKQKESFVKEYQNTLSNLNGRQIDFNKSSISSIGGIGGGATPFQSEDLSKDINNVETLLKNTVKETQDLKLLYQQELAKKTLFGFDPNIDDKVDEISTTITPQNILNTGIELQNVGDIKKQRNLKLLSENQRAFTAFDILSGNVSNLGIGSEKEGILKGDLTEEKYKLSDVDRAYYTYIGGNSQIESLKESTKSDREKVKQIDQEILRISEELGDSVETPEIKKYINSLQQEKKNVINTELKKTQLIDKIKSIVDSDSKSYIEYKKSKDLQNNELVRGIAIPAVLRTVNDLLTTTQVGSANLISKASSMITDTQQEYDLLSEELESRKNRIAAGSPGILKGTLPYDEAQLQKEQAFGFDNEGNFFFNPSMIPALAARTTLESGGIGAYGSLASGVKSQVLRNIAQAGLMYIPTASLFGDRILRGEELKGLSKGQAWGAAAGLIAIETISELANLFEMSLFAGKPKLLSDVSISDVQRIAYKEGLRKTFGSNKYDKLVDLLTDSKIFAKEAFKQGNMEYLEEGIGALGGAAESQLINYYNPEYSTENELNLQDQIVSYLSTQVGMLPMGGVAGYYAVKEANKTALFIAAESPEMFVQGIKKDLQKGTITPSEANKRLKLVEQASLIKTQLTDAFKNIDQSVTKSGKPIDEASKQAAKLDLFNIAYNKNELEQRILEEPSDKKKDVLLEELNETLELFSEKLQQTREPKKEASVKQIQEKLLNDNYSDKYINSFINPENIQNKIKELVVEKDKFQDEEIQKLYDDKISKFQDRLKTATKETEKKKSVIEQEKENINTLPKVELEKIQSLSEIQEKYPDLSEDEQEQIYLYVSEKLDTLDKEENTAIFKDDKGNTKSFKVGELVSYQGSNFIVKKDEEGNPYLFNDKTKAKVTPSDVNDFEKYTSKEPQKVQPVTTQDLQGIQTNLKEAFGIKEEIPTEEQTQEGSVGVGGDVESKKSEIEKLNNEIDSFDNEYNSLVDIVNKEDRRLNAPKSENEIKLNELQDKINILRDKRDKIEQSLKETSQSGSVSLEDKKVDIERRIIITGTDGGFTDINVSNKDNANSGTFADLRRRYSDEKYIIEYGKGDTKKTLFSDLSLSSKKDSYHFYITDKSTNKKYYVVGISNRVLGNDPDRNGSLFASIEDTGNITDFERTVMELALIDAFEKKVKERPKIFAPIPQEFIDKINTKYLAELDALEQPKEEKVLLEEELKEKLNKAEEKLKATLIEDVPITETEFKELALEIKDLRNKLGIKDTLVENKEEKVEEEQNKENKIAESKMQKVYFPLSTTPQQVTFTGVANETFIQTQANTLEKLRKESELKSFEEQGIFVTVMNNTFPLDKKHQPNNTLNAVKENKITEQIVKDGRIAVLTNKQGDVLYFDTEGNRTTKEKGSVVYQPLRGKLKDGKLDMFNQNIPTQEELKQAGELERFNKDIEKLTELRESKEPIILQIAEITKGVKKFDKSEPSKINLSTHDLLIKSNGIVVTVDKSTKQENPVYRAKLQEAGLSDFITALMDMNNKEGLSEELQNSWQQRRDFLERVIYTSASTRRIRFDKNNLILTSAEDVNNLPLNVDKSLLNKLFSWYTWDGNKFIPNNFKTYQEFLADKLQTREGNPTTFNSYIKLGDNIVKNVTPVEKSPKTEEKSLQETPIKKEFKKSERSKSIKINTNGTGLSAFGKNTELKRVKLLGKKVTELQNQQAKNWFDTYLKNSGVKFKDLRDIVNSDAYATWSTASIKLWKGGDFTDLYHEAFHDFTQLFLTKEQKQSLYGELRKVKPGISDFEAEELLAEDFYKYMLSGQKLILNNRIKRNSIFRKIYNFLRELFTGTPSLEVIYQKLATGNTSSYKKNINNALFGELNKNIPGLTFTESINLYKALDSLIAKQFRAFQIPISRLFKETKMIEATYQQVALDLKTSLDENEEYYNSLVDKYNNSDELTQQTLLPEITSLDKLVSNLFFVLENFNEVRAKHLTESEFLKISKKFVPEEIIDELSPDTKDSIYDDREQESAKDRASDQMIYLLASLPKYINKNGEKVLKYNSYLDVIEDITEFDLAWNKLAKTLTGEKDYKTMITKIQELAKLNPEYDALLEALPNPNVNGKELSLLEMQLRNQFINTFSQPYIPLKFANWWKDVSSGELKVGVKEAIGKSYQLLKQDWDEIIQSVPNEYRILDETTGQQFVDVDKIAEDFENLSKLRLKRKEEFLAAIGFEFSPQAKESPEYKDLITDDLTLGRIYNAIKQFVELKNGILPKGYELTDTEKEFLNKPVVSIIDAVSKGLYGNDVRSIERIGSKPVLIKGQKENIEFIQNIELNYSDKYFSDNVLNSEASNVYAIRPWSQQAVIYNLLNEPKFKTYSDLILDSVGAYFDISKNPDADNIYLNSVFDLSTGNRRLDRKGNPVKINLINWNGLEINFGEETKGAKTTSLTRFEKLIQDIAPLLTNGIKEHIRYGDKTTSNGTEVIFSRFTETTNDNPYLPVDIKQFRETYLPKEAKAIFRNILYSALLQTNQYFYKNIGKDFSNFNKNLEKEEYWGYFDGILSKETKDKIISEGLTKEQIDIYAVIDKYQEDINKDLEQFLKNDVKLVKEELNSNDIVTFEDYIPNEKLLKNSQYGENEQDRFETLLRAFTINSYIMNLEHTRLMFQDPRFYDNKKGSYREAFKRFSKGSSIGTIGVNDDQQNEFLQGTRLEKQEYDRKNSDNKSSEWTETGIENTVIFDDIVISADDFIQEVEKIYKGKPKEEQLAVSKAYGDITSTDAFGVCTFDWYRQWEIRSGNDNWNKEKEELYKKIVTNQPISEDENTKAFLFFPPKKIRVVGQTFDSKTKRFVPIDYKFAVSPLLPQIVKGKAFGAVKDNMLRQNVSIATFKSASKHSSIVNSNGTNNKFYNIDGSVNTEDYVTNPVFTEFIFEVQASPKDYKEEVSFSTQLRKLLFVNQFNNGYPIDYKGKDWNELSEEEKKKSSKIYKLEQDFGNTINNLVQNEKERLLKSLDVKVDKKGNYTISEEKLSQLLEQEFKSRNLPNNVLKSIQIVNGKFKYALDASLQRETIEQVILSIVDNRLRKQKGLGESLIQASSIGYENLNFDRVDSWKSINGNDLPFYKYNEGKPTSAQKVKIALQGDFKKLLNLPQVKSLSKTENITELEALNKLLKEEEFSETIKELISITGVRIPVQGHNSMEFMEVYEFLPEEAGSVIIVSPALVAKSGGDFDWDKITSLYNSFNITEGGILVYPSESEKINKQVYKELKKEFEERIENRPDYYNNLLKAIFSISPEELQEELLSEDIFQKKSIPSLATFNKIQTKKGLNNKLNNIIREVLEQPEMYEQLITPNSTYLFEPIADQRQEALSKKKPTYSDIPKVTESLNQFESNTVGKQSLGIGAIWNTLFAQMQKAGVTLEKEYVTNITGKNPTVKYTANRLPHNETKEGNVSLSGIFSQPYNKTKYRISESISQLMNGWVDVAKKDWVFYINGRKEIAPTMLYAATTGIHKDILVGFFNQPVIYDYVKNLQNYKSSITKFKDRKLFDEAKKNAIFDTLNKYLKDVEDPLITVVNLKDESPWQDMRLAVSEKNSIKFWSALNKMRGLANDNKEAFNPDSFMKFAIPKDKKLAKPTTEQEKLNQALYLIQFLEFQEQGNIVEKLRRVVNQDTEKPVNIQYSKERQVRRAELKDYKLIADSYIDKMVNESVIKAFTHSKTGIDKFIQNLTENIFEVTNNPVFNRFLYDEFNKPTEKNNIPFQVKFDIYEDWVKAVKNDLISYLYQNYVYKPNSTEKVAKYVFQLMKPSTALALELENIKKTNSELVENNQLLQFLIRDNSREKLGGKPKIVNIKLRKERIDNTTKNILTEGFEELLNSEDPTIQQFARKLAHFAFIQSGLSKSPISFADIIPQEYYGEDISDIIKAFSDLMKNNPIEAKRQLERFYNDFFKRYNRKFFTANQVLNEETNQYENDIDFQKEAFRGKNYIDSRVYDLLSKKQNNAIKEQQNFLDNIKTISTVSETQFTENTAKESPNNFYIYEFNESGSGKLGSSKVRGENLPNTAPIVLMKQARTEGGNWTDNTYAKNIEIINSSISEAIAKIQQQSPKQIVFPVNITEFSKLKEFAPLTYKYLVQELKNNFNISLENNNFGEIQEEIPMEQKAIEQPIQNKEVNKPEDFTNHSGGAYGGDTFWDIIGKTFGFTNNKHYRDAGNTSLSKQLRDKGIKAEVLSKEQMDKARIEVENIIGKKYPDTLQGNLQVRNYYQVANSDGVFAIAKLDTDKGFKSTSVLGGTNTAVQLGIKLNKPVYVWDIFTEKWYKFDINSNQFEPTETPVLTKNFAGVGSRDIENYQVKNKETDKWESRKEYVGKEKEEKAKQAIKDVYQNTLNKIQKQPINKEIKPNKYGSFGKDKEMFDAYIKGGLEAVKELVAKRKQNREKYNEELKGLSSLLDRMDELENKKTKTDSETNELIDVYKQLRDDWGMDIKNQPTEIKPKIDSNLDKQRLLLQEIDNNVQEQMIEVRKGVKMNQNVLNRLEQKEKDLRKQLNSLKEQPIVEETKEEIPNVFGMNGIGYSKNTDDNSKTFYYIAAPYGLKDEKGKFLAWEEIKNNYSITEKEYERAYKESLIVNKKQQEQKEKQTLEKQKELDYWNNSKNNIVDKVFPFNVGENEKGFPYEHKVKIKKVHLLENGNYRILAHNLVNGRDYDMITNDSGSVISYTRNGKTFEGEVNDEIVFGINDFVNPLMDKTKEENKILKYIEEFGKSNFDKLIKNYPDLSVLYVPNNAKLLDITEEEGEYESIDYDNLFKNIQNAQKAGLNIDNTNILIWNSNTEQSLTLNEFFNIIKNEINQINPRIFNKNQLDLFDQNINKIKPKGKPEIDITDQDNC